MAKQTDDQVACQATGQVDDQVAGQTNDQTAGQVNNQVTDQAVDQAVNQTAAQATGQTNDQATGQTNGQATGQTNDQTDDQTQRFLIKFTNLYNDFRLPVCEGNESQFLNKPYLILTADDPEKLFKVVRRSVLVKHLLELIDHEQDKERFLAGLKQNELIARRPNWKTESFRLQVDTFNQTFELKEKVDKMEELDFLPFDGVIDLKNPTNVFHLIECYQDGNPESRSRPVQFYFARYMMDGNRRLINDLKLSKRKFISNTSMDTTLSLIMANLARVKKNDLCLDMFAGSGGLLVAAGAFGAYCFGSDIDYKLLHGISKSSRAGQKERDKEESIRANFRQYNMEDRYLDVIVADSSLPLWRENSVKFDAIITDPPYSIRESALKIGARKENVKIPEEYLSRHTPQKVQYNLHELISDLLGFASANLVLNGRLVFFYPIGKCTYDESDLPKHRCFRLVSHEKQVLQGKLLRVLICLEKIAEPLEIGDAEQGTGLEEVPDEAKYFKENFHRNRQKVPLGSEAQKEL